MATTRKPSVLFLSEDSPSQKLAKWKVNSVAEQYRPQYTGAEDLEWTSWIIFHFNFHLQCKLRCSAGCSAAVLMKCWNTFDFRFMPSSCSEYQVTLYTHTVHIHVNGMWNRELYVTTMKIIEITWIVSPPSFFFLLWIEFEFLC